MGWAAKLLPWWSYGEIKIYLLDNRRFLKLNIYLKSSHNSNFGSIFNLLDRFCSILMILVEVNLHQGNRWSHQTHPIFYRLHQSLPISQSLIIWRFSKFILTYLFNSSTIMAKMPPIQETPKNIHIIKINLYQG